MFFEHMDLPQLHGAEKMELRLEELKAPIEVHFANGVPHPITLQAKDMAF
jgi:hypothetical protein